MEEKIFTNREDELNALLSTLERKGPEFVILYGRRRIGKSRLLKEVEKRARIDVFVMLEDADYATNLKKFGDAIAEKFKFPSFSPASFREAFRALPAGSTVVMDEYSYLSGSAGEFQAIWEEVAKPKGLKIVLSGSLIRIMEDMNYSLKSPLYGRATKMLKLAPLSFANVRKWYGNADLNELLKTYFCIGGIPRYLEIIERPNVECIREAFFSKDSLLLREGKLLLKESFPASVLVPKILFSIAGGNSEASKIANSVQIKANEMGKYLAMLSDYGFVEKKYPALGGGKKDARFYVADRFFSFWSRFVWPHYGEIESGATAGAIRGFERDFGTFCGLEFERTVVELLREFPKMLPFPFDAVGRQWGRIPPKFKPEKGKNQYEIDICAVNEKTQEILLGECKWSDGIKAQDIAEALDEKSRFVGWHIGDRKESFAIFAKSFSSRVSEFLGRSVLCFDLENMRNILF